MKKISRIQKAKIYCIKHGHANYGYRFWGYVYCGRCGEQIDDKLWGIFPMAEKFAFANCSDSPCQFCDPIIAKLNKKDRKMFDELKRMNKTSDFGADAERAINKLKIEW